MAKFRVIIALIWKYTCSVGKTIRTPKMSLRRYKTGKKYLLSFIWIGDGLAFFSLFVVEIKSLIWLLFWSAFSLESTWWFSRLFYKEVLFFSSEQMMFELVGSFFGILKSLIPETSVENFFLNTESSIISFSL